jgi:hypothetical protein
MGIDAGVRMAEAILLGRETMTALTIPFLARFVGVLALLVEDRVS